MRSWNKHLKLLTWSKKRGGNVKFCLCTNSSKQQKYLSEDNIISSLMLQSLIISLIIDVFEGRYIKIFFISLGHISMKRYPKIKWRKWNSEGTAFAGIMCQVNYEHKNCSIWKRKESYYLCKMFYKMLPFGNTSCQTYWTRYLA